MAVSTGKRLPETEAMHEIPGENAIYAAARIVNLRMT